MPALRPPNEFMRRLKAFDYRLDCRWSDLRSCWLIERQVPDQCQLLGGTGNTDLEDHVSAAARKIILFEVDRECLDERVFFTLYDSDIVRQGGADAVNEKIDAAYAATQAKSRADFRDFVRQEAKGRWRWGNAVRTLPEKFAHTGPPDGMSIN